ncbi:catalase-domain-containing protein [Pseudovirgaria hyperparasitica]|uniref:Catalase n=1 Tax=Pseudovirgaria hyperparasitica TaxID=470096 RepID=A0A6A6WCW5_9PEZI|nr:catalase-domain-containing protein [Pseudovirgaria hyperparasitica]KAF2759894.1 catalase-domain-containing protein [Pseudovirgaria hyperparasitica]
MFTRSIGLLAFAASVTAAGCPYMGAEEARDAPAQHAGVHRRDATTDTNDFLARYELDDTDTYLTSDVGGPFSDQNSLSAGERGPTLLEDFIFRQKIQHFDHERVPERAVHARGAGAHGVFESYGDWSNITAASFLGSQGKQTPIFIRFSTVAGSRGSADTARDVHGFAVRFYTDEGNFGLSYHPGYIVGNNIPVFFIQDAILFPDLIHAVKPSPDSEIPQAATAHDTAWDFFSQQPSTLHTLFWAMAPNGIVRSYRHMDGFGVHTFRFVTDDGASKLVKFHWKSLTGKTGLVWEEAQVLAGKNADFHRQDLFESIEKQRFPEWELAVQIMDEQDQLRFGFDVLDPTKIVPEELVPLTKLGKLTLNRNPRNYFAETEQVMFQPGHIVRGIDFSEDPLLQGRIYSYLDTQLNRNGGPNFEQLPINQPRVPWHNNNRDGAGQMFIPLNTAAYSPNTLNRASPKQANQTSGRGFFTAPGRTFSGNLVRAVSSTFNDVWSQPRLFYNSLPPVEQQFLINAIRFETSNLKSDIVKNNVLIQLNRVSHDIASRVASALGLTAPAPDATYYHDNKTAGVAVFGTPLLRLDGLRVGLLTTAADTTDYTSLKSALATHNVDLVVVAEHYGGSSTTQTYAQADATGFDAVIAAADPSFFSPITSTPEFPSGRPLSILLDAYRWGKPVADLKGVFKGVAIPDGEGVIVASGADEGFVGKLVDALRTFKFLGRFPVDGKA